MQEREREQLPVPPDSRPEWEQPRWRQDFPIDAPQDEYISRRDFTKFMVLTSFAFVVGQLWILAQNLFRRQNPKPPVREIAALDSIPVGGSLVFDYPERHNRCILVRLGEITVVAYSQLCTHLSCAVIPQPERGCFHCPCHEGFFDLKTGRPVAGPPRRPLPRVQLAIRDGRIYATGVEERTV